MLLRVFRPTHPEGADQRPGGAIRSETFWIWRFLRNVCFAASLTIPRLRSPDLIVQPARQNFARFRSIAACAVARRLACTRFLKTDVLTVAIATCGSNL